MSQGAEWASRHTWAPDALLALAVAAVLGSLSISAAQGIDWPRGWDIALVSAFAVMHVAAAIRTRAAAWGFAAASVAMVLIALSPDGRVVRPAANGLTEVPALFLPSSLVYLLVLYSVASRLPAVPSRAALLVGLAGGVIVATKTANTFGEVASVGWLVRLYIGLGFVVTVFATWSLGRLALIRRGRTATERTETARLAVLDERTRIAREMHDIVAHSLAVIVRQAEGGAYVAQRTPEQAARALRTIADTGRGALTDMRGLLGILRDPDCQPTPASQPTLADLPTLVSGVRDSGIAADFTEVGAPFVVGNATELAAFRVVQEALTNAVKYAGPRARVDVTVQWRHADLAIEVTDDGGERGVQQSVPGAGAGLQGLRERVTAVGGTLRADRHARGFQVQVSFPNPHAGGKG
ncbi:MAG: sensor histidine kinase [Pseudonocardiales bacterium]|nr:MAG: sensor histidine kinase [Pseudonocardiales bacterium]